MNYFRMIKYVFVILFCCCLLIPGCSQDPAHDAESSLNEVKISYEQDRKEVLINSWPDEKLLNKFAEYWHKRLSGDIDGAWEMEAPHFQYLAGQGKYRNYLARSEAQMPLEIEVRNIRQVTDYKYLIDAELGIRRSGQEQKVTINDRWIKLDQQWFHVVYDPVIFPFSAN